MRCVLSNPALHREVVAQWRAKGALELVNVVANDFLGMCEGDPGGFIIFAQMPEPQPAWAPQYHREMQPMWARKI